MNPNFYRRESRTLERMIGLYCRKNHGTGGALCADCGELREYALKRLAACRFREDKPNCSACAVHCYKPALRARMAAVMRFSGPRMLWRHPLSAIRHLLRGRRKPVSGPNGA